MFCLSDDDVGIQKPPEAIAILHDGLLKLTNLDLLEI